METDFSEKTYRLLETLSQRQDLSQRELAHKTGLSLGMVNLILKRLIKTGYIKVAAFNSKKAGYILTPKGVAERMVRSYQYFLRAYRTFHESRARIDGLIDSLLKKNHREFVILGEGEVAGLVEMAFRSRGPENVRIRRVQKQEAAGAREVVLDCRLGVEENAVGISILEQILNVSVPVGTEKEIA